MVDTLSGGKCGSSAGHQRSASSTRWRERGRRSESENGSDKVAEKKILEFVVSNGLPPTFCSVRVVS